MAFRLHRHSNSSRPRAIAMCAQLWQWQGAWFSLFNGNNATMPHNAIHCHTMPVKWLAVFGKGLDKLILSDDVSSAVSSNVKQNIFLDSKVQPPRAFLKHLVVSCGSLAGSHEGTELELKLSVCTMNSKK